MVNIFYEEVIPSTQPAPAPAPPPPSTPIPVSNPIEMPSYPTPTPEVPALPPQQPTLYNGYTISALPYGYYESQEYANRLSNISQMFPRPVFYPKSAKMDLGQYRANVQQLKFKIQERIRTFFEAFKSVSNKYQEII